MNERSKDGWVKRVKDGWVKWLEIITGADGWGSSRDPTWGGPLLSDAGLGVNSDTGRALLAVGVPSTGFTFLTSLTRLEDVMVSQADIRAPTEKAVGSSCRRRICGVLLSFSCIWDMRWETGSSAGSQPFSWELADEEGVGADSAGVVTWNNVKQIPVNKHTFLKCVIG